MIRVISSFADGPVNFHSTGPAEDQIQKLISSTGAGFFESHLILKSLNTVTLSCIIGDAISIVRYEESPS